MDAGGSRFKDCLDYSEWNAGSYYVFHRHTFDSQGKAGTVNCVLGPGEEKMGKKS